MEGSKTGNDADGYFIVQYVCSWWSSGMYEQNRKARSRLERNRPSRSKKTRCMADGARSIETLRKRIR